MRSAVAILVITVAGVLSMSAQNIADMEAAKIYCDSAPLQRIEGIWDMTTADCKVLICRVTDSDSEYDIIVLESDDSRLLPGDVLGVVESSANPDQFKLTFKTGVKWNVNCLATLSADEMSLRIERPKRKLKLSPYMLLHKFWGLFRYESDNPVDRLQQGMVRLYPRGVVDSANRFHIRYL